jgi:hypothetical protein
MQVRTPERKLKATNSEAPKIIAKLPESFYWKEHWSDERINKCDCKWNTEYLECDQFNEGPNYELILAVASTAEFIFRQPHCWIIPSMDQTMWLEHLVE